MVRDSHGNLYGTTGDGGLGLGGGVVYKLDAEGNYTVLHSFSRYDLPNGLLLAPDGLYGTTAGGETVYKLDASADYTVLYNFMGGADGYEPTGGVSRDSGRQPDRNYPGRRGYGYGVMFALTGVQ